MTIGLLMGVPVLVARETGAGNDAAPGRIWRRGLAFGLALCALLQFSETLYLATGQAPELAARILQVVAFVLPASRPYHVSVAFLEACIGPASRSRRSSPGISRNWG